MCGENKYFKIRVGFRIGATVLKYRHVQLEYKTALDITCRHGGQMGSAFDSRFKPWPRTLYCVPGQDT